MDCVIPSFCINLRASHSSPPLSRDQDHRFSSLMQPAVSISAVSACGCPEACTVRDTASSGIFNDKRELNCYGTFFNIPQNHSYLDCLVYFPYIFLKNLNQRWPCLLLYFYLSITTVLLPASSKIINPHRSQLKPHV